MKSRRNGSERWRTKSARNMTVPLSSETTTISRPRKSRSISRAITRMRRAICSSVMSTRSTSLRQRRGTFLAGVLSLADTSFNLNVFGIVLVLGRVTAVLTLEIHLVLFDVSGKHIVGAQAEHLRETDEKMEKINDLDPRVLVVEFLILCPPFPRHAVGEFGDFLRHGAAIIQNPFGFFRLAHAVGFDADAFVEGFLHAEQIAELVGFFHARSIC